MPRLLVFDLKGQRWHLSVVGPDPRTPLTYAVCVCMGGERLCRQPGDARDAECTVRGRRAWHSPAVLLGVRSALAAMPVLGRANRPRRLGLGYTRGAAVEVHAAAPAPKNTYLQALDAETAEDATAPAADERRAEERRAARRRRVFHLDEDVRGWSDYLPCAFHPRTVHEVAAPAPFVHHAQGRAALATTEEVRTRPPRYVRMHPHSYVRADLAGHVHGRAPAVLH
jgi:hypothetical protein